VTHRRQTSIPTVRFDRLHHAGELQRLAEACRDWGFFALTGHGLDDSLRRDTLALLRAFFALPANEKRRVERSATNPWGYFDRELTKNTRDWKQIFDVGEAEADGPLAGCEPQWPDRPEGFRGGLERHREHGEHIAAVLLRAIANTLGADGDALASAFTPRHSSFLRLNHYPRCPRPQAPPGLEVATAGHLGINHHTDAGALTVLLTDDVPGLQVYRGGHWHTVEPSSGALVINIGDVVQVWSNGRYRAPLHRVLANAERERYSLAYFYNPAPSASYAPLPELGEPRYRPIRWSEFRAARAAGDYADAGEEIQIAHFRR